MVHQWVARFEKACEAGQPDWKSLIQSAAVDFGGSPGVEGVVAGAATGVVAAGAAGAVAVAAGIASR